MQPASINLLESIPLTVNGKVDKDKLPAPQFQYTASQWEAPTTEIQQQIAQIWAQVLSQDASKISIHDDFFALGGQSLLLMKLISAVEQQYQLEVDVKDMFSHATLVEQANYLEQRVEQQKLLQQVQKQVTEEQDLNELTI